VTAQQAQKSNQIIWIIMALCAIAGITFIGHAIITWNRADVIVEWETASELDTVGFNVMRSESPAGPFIQVNTDLIPAASDTLTGSQYKYKDTDTQPGITYFYMLEEIELTGQSNQHGPISVKAQNYATLEFVFGMLLIMGALLSTFRVYREAREKQENPTQ
jgi:hypothetical protein